LCGHIPQKEDGSLILGRLGEDMTVDEGYASARCCAENILNTLYKELDGDWTRIVRIVKLVGFVNSASHFCQQPAVMNGASDLFVEIFGEAGLHARSAVGVNVLPLGVATEVEAIVEIRD
jgi:6-phosphogluconolactonase